MRCDLKWTRRKSAAMGGEYRSSFIQMSDGTVAMVGRSSRGWFGVLHLFGRRVWLLPIKYGSKTDAL